MAAPILLASILVLLGTVIPTHAFAPPLSTAKSHTTHSPRRHSAERLSKQTLTQRRQSLSLLRSTVAATTTVSTVTLPHTEFYPSDSTDSTPVVFLHGLLGSKRNFASLAKSLGTQLDTKRRIVGVDLRNHGDHSPESWQDDMSYPTMAQDVLHFLKEQELSKVVLVAHSMGGKVAQALALLHPDVVEGLVIIDMAPVEYGKEEPHWKAVTSILETLHSVPIATGDDEKTTKADVDKALRKVVPDPALRAFCLTNWDARNHQWAIPVDKIVQQLEVLAGFDLGSQSSSKEQQQYHGDTFFIHGGQSKFVRHAHVETIQQFFPNHMLTTIRGAGHWVHAEAPDDTIALLKRYLDR